MTIEGGRGNQGDFDNIGKELMFVRSICTVFSTSENWIEGVRTGRLGETYNLWIVIEDYIDPKGHQPRCA